MNSGLLNGVDEFCTDVYVADYSHVDNDDRRIIITAEKPSDLECFHLENRNKVRFYGANLEESPGLFKGHKNCECMFEAISRNPKSWVCLVELKYCLEKNVQDNAQKAYVQLCDTLDFLIKRKIIDVERQRIYLNISIPEHSTKEPFTSFLFSQDEVLSYYERGRVIPLGVNHLLIMTPVHIHVPKETV